MIKARKRGRIWVGTAAGAASGALVFGLISLATVDRDPDGMDMSGVANAGLITLGAISGAALGAAISSIKIIIPVNGNMDSFRNSKEKIRKISVKK